MSAVKSVPSPQLSPSYGGDMTSELSPQGDRSWDAMNGNDTGNHNDNNGVSLSEDGTLPNVGELSLTPERKQKRRVSSSSIPLQPTPEEPPSHQQQHIQPPGVQIPVSPQPNYGAPVPFQLSPPPQPTFEPIFHLVDSTFPWAIGSTDGSVAYVRLKDQQQQLLQQQQQQQQQLQNDSSNTNEDLVSDGAVIGPADDGQGIQNGNPGVSPAQAAPTAAEAAIGQAVAVINAGRSLYHDKLFHNSSSHVEAILSGSCEVMGFDIAEMWLRTGPKTHQLTNSHLRPAALEDSVRQEVVDVYYGERSNERTHKLSPALCKRAKDANDVVWVTGHTPNGAEALKTSLSNVRTAVAVPVCHEVSNTNVTIIYFSLRRIILKPAAVEFLIHMSLSAAVTSVNSLDTDGLLDRAEGVRTDQDGRAAVMSSSAGHHQLSKTTGGAGRKQKSALSKCYQRANRTSITGARLDLQWRQLHNVEYLTDGGNSWIHTAVFDGKPVVVKTLRPECQDSAMALHEIEAEVAVHSRLNHPNIVRVIGAGWTSKKIRFIVLERLDGGTLTQLLGYDTRIRDKRGRFWGKKPKQSYLDVLRCARSLACALQYCNEQAIPGSMVLHRDLKPDNIGFTLDGQVKLIDFGLARLVENANPESNETYQMSGETGSLRYMAPEVADRLPYNHKADVYSFGIILWEMNAGKRPFNGLSRETFYENVVHGGERPHLSKRWPPELNKLISSCWSTDIDERPSFRQIVDAIDILLTSEKGGILEGKTGKALKSFAKIIDRHSTWF